jgi:hypothetical protein
MSYRRFKDAQGRAWEAWEVHPSTVERRLSSERRGRGRVTADRRQQHEFRLVIPSELRDGWLAFQGSFEKVRLAPIPEGWMALSDADLAELVMRAGERTRQAS